MKDKSIGVFLAVAAAAAMLAFAPASGWAQQEKGKAKGKGGGTGFLQEIGPTGPLPRMPDGKPDLSGVWSPGLTFGTLGQVPLQPWAEKVLKARRDTLSKDDPEGNCLPAGVPRISPFPQKFVQTANLVVVLDEGNVHSYRQFFLDGRGHPPDLDPLWMGDSIAKWDGDTLVVDTIGFNDKTWLNGQGVPHSEELHVIERYHRVDLGHMDIDITIEDPKTFTKPHSFKRAYTLLPKWEIHEYVCNEFNIDFEHLVGK